MMATIFVRVNDTHGMHMPCRNAICDAVLRAILEVWDELVGLIAVERESPEHETSGCVNL